MPDARPRSDSTLASAAGSGLPTRRRTIGSVPARSASTVASSLRSAGSGIKSTASGIKSTASVPPVNVDLPIAPASSDHRSVPSASAKRPTTPVTAMPNVGSSSAPFASCPSARIDPSAASAPKSLPAAVMFSACTVPVGTNASAACTPSRSPASATRAVRSRARSSAGTCSATVGPEPSGFARSVPVAAGRRSPALSSRTEAVNAVPSRCASSTARTAPNPSVRAARASVTSGAAAVSVPRTLARPSVCASRDASIAPALTRTSPCAPAACSSSARRRPLSCSLPVAASEPGAIFRFALAVRHRSAAPLAPTVSASAATCASAVSPESDTIRCPAYTTTTLPSVTPSDIPLASRTSASTTGPSAARYAANGSPPPLPPPGWIVTSSVGCARLTATGRTLPVSKGNNAMRIASVPTRPSRTPGMRTVALRASTEGCGKKRSLSDS